MNWTNNSTTLNDVLRKAVDAQMRCRKNWMGATMTVADYLGVSPQLVRRRYYDEVTREPKSRNSLLAAKCWDFLAMVAQRERAWVENLALEVEQNRLRLQLGLPLEGTVNAQSDGKSAARCVGRDEADIAAARQALGEFEGLKSRASV